MKTLIPSSGTPGTPVVRSRRGEIAWEPDSICYCWSIDSGTVLTMDKQGLVIEAYRLKEGEFVTTMARQGE